MQIDLTQNFGQYLNPQARNIEEYEVFLTVGDIDNRLRCC
ncbi:hypothetical protein O53_3556 [Microcystis aeruginosa TAIHU98]|jgi:hypothetical protein|uniref:Uncharacterized protein n=3 Tax=Microcystis aeruginosa TaxID=1126 RepID=I4IW37_MICAE|nr:hypothetical protein BH695_3839 [Microcystis aeruginosa PCC 7806SL]ELP54732.1 hypothetical protein O53_3556 [Microcystis aeruginosa TAIHU98]CCI34044.1 hypothetical protein MICAI_590008 [Microcystis sp. T1-4]CCI38511.1 hypothetical protein MICAK_460009 [Microcystis aeruginosa PCC 9701]